MRNHLFNRRLIQTTLRYAVIGAAFTTLSLLACSVPVFRYAIEHWAADAYQAVVFHRGTLSPAEQELVSQLGAEGEAGKIHANVAVRTIDLDQESDPQVLDFWRQLGAESEPWLVLRYPLTTGLPGNIWSGPLAEPAIRQICDSPVRREIANRIGSGESAVWVLLENGDKEKDDAADELLKSRLEYLSGVLELPTLDAQDIANGLISIGQDDLKLRFSVLRLSRNDPNEQVFSKMLLGTEADLAEINEPMVFPVFGRGRALYALVGKGINHSTIDEAATFLIGKCSCQVKELNPGVDLLMAADWESLTNGNSSSNTPAPPAPEIVEAAPETVTISSDTEPASSDTSGSESHWKLIMNIAGGLLLAGLAASGFVLLRRR